VSKPETTAAMNSGSAWVASASTSATTDPAPNVTNVTTRRWLGATIAHENMMKAAASPAPVQKMARST
jgi:hypothetical protein